MSTAHAMAEAVEDLFPGQFTLEVREIMRDFGFEEFDAWHKKTWKWALDRPWRAVAGQRLIDCFPRVSVGVQRRMLRPFAEEAARRFSDSPPDLIVANHGFLTTALTMAQHEYGMDVPVLTFQTSTLDASAVWAEPRSERVVLGSQAAKEKLVRLGVREDRIDVVGYPIRRNVLQAPAKEEARRGLGLRDLFTCMISLGGEGVGGVPQDIIDALRGLSFDVQIVVICGRNDALRVELEGRGDALLRPVGYVDDMGRYLAAADVVVGKTGFTAVFEAMAVGRPVLAPRTSGGIENEVIGFMEATGTGWFTPSMEDLAERIREFHDKPELLRAIHDRTRRYDFQDMTDRLASYVAHYARHREPDLSLCWEGIAVPQPAE